MAQCLLLVDKDLFSFLPQQQQYQPSLSVRKAAAVSRVGLKLIIIFIINKTVN